MSSFSSILKLAFVLENPKSTNSFRFCELLWLSPTDFSSPDIFGHLGFYPGADIHCVQKMKPNDPGDPLPVFLVPSAVLAYPVKYLKSLLKN